MQMVQQLMYSLRLVTYVKKRKQARIPEKQTLNITSASCFFFIWFWNANSYYITKWAETFVSTTRCQKKNGQTVITRLVKLSLIKKTDLW